MQIKRMAMFAAAACALGLAGCGKNGGGPTAPIINTTQDVFALNTTMSNSSGGATLIEATINLDNRDVADSCPEADRVPIVNDDGDISGFSCLAPPSASVPMSAFGELSPGSHTLTFQVNSQTTRSARTPYTVSAFTLQIRNLSGAVLKSIDLPTQSGTLGANAGSINYSFSF